VKIFFSSVAAVVFLIASQQAAALGASADPSLAPSGTYQIDKAHTRIQWRLSHLGTSYYVGWFSKFDATLRFDSAAPERSSISASVNTRSVTTLDPAFDEEIASDKFLGASKAELITFDSRTLKVTGPNTGEVTGDLSLNGVTRPVQLNVTFVGGMQSPLKNAYVIGFSASGTIKRSDFGIVEYLDFGLGDEVTITIDTEFDHKP
jgi:polyisoprenoid-binding protein YceI